MSKDGIIGPRVRGRVTCQCGVLATRMLHKYEGLGLLRMSRAPCGEDHQFFVQKTGFGVRV